MKTLHLLRHGKSSWDMTGAADIDRPLLVKGISNTQYVAQTIKEKYGLPDLIVSSPANRAIHTAIVFARSLGLNQNLIKINENIYEASASTIIDIIEDTPALVKSLVVVGHNPTFTEVSNLFLSIPIDNLPTSGIVTLQFNSKDWNIIDILPVNAEITYPKKD